MYLHGLQLDIVWENPTENCTRVARLLSDAPPQRGSLLVLPELFATGFSMNIPVVAATAPQAEEFCAKLAAEHEIFIIAGIGVAAKKGRAQNHAIVFSPHGVELARYSKLHPFSYGRETEFYDAGSEVATFDWNGLRVAPFVCYDLRFPEIFREARADVYCIGANWPAARAEHWNVLLRARAIENQAYVIGVNRCGADPFLAYDGGSLIVGPRGEILADAGRDEQLVGANMDVEDLYCYREEFPALKDRKK